MIEKSVLICGRSGTGKSYSLRNIRNPEGVMYLNCEGKSLPFPNKFQKFDVTEPMQIYEALTAVNDMNDVHTVVIDSASYLMEMFETQIVNTSSNTQRAWGDYASFIKDLCLVYLKKCTKNVVILSHVVSVYNSDLLINETRANIKGSVGKGNGFESYFTNVIYTKIVPVDKLKPNDCLAITPKDEKKGFKHVFQVEVTKETVHESIKVPPGIFDDDVTYIDNDVQIVLDKLEKFYAN